MRESTTKQLSHLQSLDGKLKALWAVPQFALPVQTNASPTEPHLHMRARFVTGIVKDAIAGRRFEGDILDEKYTQELFLYGQEALDNLFLAAKTFFGNFKEPTATTPSVFVRALDERPRPDESDTEGKRVW